MEKESKFWYKEKIGLIFSEVIGGFFSIAFIKAIFSSFAYFYMSKLYGERKFTIKKIIVFMHVPLYVMRKIFI